MPGPGYRQAREPANPSTSWRCSRPSATRRASPCTEELARSTAALSASRPGRALGLHANTVRLHLERLREAGPGRRRGRAPGHRRPAPAPLLPRAPGRPGSGFDPPAHALLAGLLAAMAERVGADADDATATGRVWGADAGTRTRARQLPRRAGGRAHQARVRACARDRRLRRGPARIDFLHCPFRELAEAYPELVCNLHRGLCEGVVDAVGGGTVEEFATLYDPEPCHVTVGLGSTPG